MDGCAVSCCVMRRGDMGFVWLVVVCGVAECGMGFIVASCGVC